MLTSHHYMSHHYMSRTIQATRILYAHIRTHQSTIQPSVKNCFQSTWQMCRSINSIALSANWQHFSLVRSCYLLWQTFLFVVSFLYSRTIYVVICSFYYQSIPTGFISKKKKYSIVVVSLHHVMPHACLIFTN